ncbi:hypothetical protein [Nitrosospira multiformis]|uniref:hypothetical protein n=1 Tax=Nitrosospira multiformis TaxID=1231 RepID=UPI000895A4A6|nr:hypothetical protein [Nitrosospira multiformis]SEA47509.1 hypothetical protein SAMN05216411_11045 [Nitrosospira multiformis]
MGLEAAGFPFHELNPFKKRDKGRSLGESRAANEVKEKSRQDLNQERGAVLKVSNYFAISSLNQSPEIKKFTLEGSIQYERTIDLRLREEKNSYR